MCSASFYLQLFQKAVFCYCFGLHSVDYKLIGVANFQSKIKTPHNTLLPHPSSIDSNSIAYSSVPQHTLELKSLLLLRKPTRLLAPPPWVYISNINISTTTAPIPPFPSPGYHPLEEFQQLITINA